MPASEPVSKGRRAAAERACALAEAEGFGLVGICDAEPSAHAQVLRDWLTAGKHGEMAYLADGAACRLDPDHLQRGARSILAVADAYGPRSIDPPPPANADEPRGRVARYAWGDDYHKVIKKRLHRLADTLSAEFPGHAFRAAVDTAPVLEREHAGRAGLGWIGKNSMLIHPRHGSYFLLGVVVTTLDLQPSAEAGWPRQTVPSTDHCGTCTRCIDACPTQCIETDRSGRSPRTIDATRCISYLTLEHRSPIAPELHAGMGDWIAGCDICQEVCPFNRDRRAAGDPLPVPMRFAPRASFSQGLPLLEVLSWTEEDRRRAFQVSALKRVKLDMLKRNALIALGNRLDDRRDPSVEARIAEIADDESEPELVRITARQVLARFAPGPAGHRETVECKSEG